MADFNPRIAFGLRATALALKAKSGRATGPAALALVAAAAYQVQGDDAALQASIRFATTFQDDQPAAGAVLHDFILSWADVDTVRHGHRAAAALQDMGPVLFDWQARKDCGHG